MELEKGRRSADNGCGDNDLRSPPMNRTLAMLASAFVAVASGCAGNPPTTRVPVARLEAASPARLVAPPAPQVLVAAPRAAAPSQVTLAELTEEQRTSALRSAGSPIRPYSPAPLPTPAPRRTIVVEREVVREPYGYAYAAARPYYAWGPHASFARVAAYTGVGAIVGHQWHHRGRGAAIGASLALLTSPWYWGGGWRGCDYWDD